MARFPVRRLLTLGLVTVLAGCASTGGPMPTLEQAVLEDGFYIDGPFPDGSGSVETSAAAGSDGWVYRCSPDAMTDRTKCELSGPSYQGARVLVWFGYSSHPETVCIVSHDFPGRVGQIRVDQNAPVTTGEDGCVAANKLLAQLQAGTKLTVRYYEWPNDWAVDQVGNLAGFNKALDVVARVRSGQGSTRKNAG